MTDVFIDRQIYKDLIDHLEEKEISVLIGPRQSGKTTLLRKIEEKVKLRGQLVEYYNLDVLAHREVVQNQTAFINFLKGKLGQKPATIIIDEIQRLKNPGQFLKGIYDLNLPYKLIVSGSSALEIKSSVSESLTGRKKIFYLFPLSFDELVNFRRPDIKALRGNQRLYQQEYLNLLNEYAQFGGYPKVVLQPTTEKKIEALEEIYSSYIEKDIKGFFGVRNETAFVTLVMLLAGQIGGITNKNLLAANIGSNRQTVDNFLSYLEKSFVIQVVRPFFRNPEKEILKSPKIYFIDLGLRNTAVKNFNNFETRQDKGQLLENFVLLKVLKEAGRLDKINFWRTKTKAEMDFVVQRGMDIFPLEVKAGRLKSPTFSLSFKSFLDTYQPKQARLINLNITGKRKIGLTKVRVQRFYEKIF
ncbi:MAG: ATP-binding protein [Patescibacteria group bacterium]